MRMTAMTSKPVSDGTLLASPFFSHWRLEPWLPCGVANAVPSEVGKPSTGNDHISHQTGKRTRHRLKKYLNKKGWQLLLLTTQEFFSFSLDPEARVYSKLHGVPKKVSTGPLLRSPKKIAEMPRKFNIQQISLGQIILTPCDGGALEIGRFAKLVDPRPPQNQPTRLWLSTLPLMAEIWRENQLIMCLLSIYDGFYTSQGVVWDFFPSTVSSRLGCLVCRGFLGCLVCRGFLRHLSLNPPVVFLATKHCSFFFGVGMVLESPEISPVSQNHQKENSRKSNLLRSRKSDWMWRPPFLKVLSSGGSPT